MKTTDIIFKKPYLINRTTCRWFIFLVSVCLVWMPVSSHAQPLSGTRTIGGINPDFATFSLAVAALELNGVGQGGVTFTVAPGIYTERFVIYSVAGASPVNPVIFLASDGPVTVNAVGTPDYDAAIRLIGADHLIFDGISITNGGTSSADYCEVGYDFVTLGTDDGASNNCIRNCSINMAAGGQRLVLSRGIRTTFSSITSFSGPSSHNIFHNISFDGAEIGIHLAGAYFMEADNIEVSHCSFGSNIPIGNQASGSAGVGYAILTVDVKGCRIFNNVVDSVCVTNTSATGSAIGIYLFRSTGDVYGNSIHYVYQGGTAVIATSAGIYASANYSGSLLIYNNFIRGILSGYSGAGSNLVSVNGMLSVNSSTTIQAPVHWYFNTVEMTAVGPQTYSSSAMCISVANGSHQVTLKNNILINKVNSGSASNWSFALIDFNGSNLKLTSDYNDLYVSGTGGYIGYNSSNQTFSPTLANWQSNNPGKDLHSVSIPPVFVSPTDLHLDSLANTLLDNAGTPVAGIIADADMTLRDLTHPCIGADEICTSPALVPEIEVSSDFIPVINEGDQIQFTAVVSNAGPSPYLQWLVNGIPAGSTSHTFITNTLQNGDRVSCRLISSQVCGSALPVMSDTITVTVYSVIPSNTSLDYFSTGWGSSDCFHALDTIVTAGNSGYFEVYEEGSVELIAGERILLLPGTVVYSGAYLRARIAPSGPFCGGAISANPASPPDAMTSRDHRNEETVRAWPNPTEGLFRLDLTGEVFMEKSFLTVTDMKGVTVIQKSLSGEQSVVLSLASQPAGFYFLTVRSAAKIFRLKVVRI